MRLFVIENKLFSRRERGSIGGRRNVILTRIASFEDSIKRLDRELKVANILHDDWSQRLLDLLDEQTQTVVRIGIREFIKDARKQVMNSNQRIISLESRIQDFADDVERERCSLAYLERGARASLFFSFWLCIKCTWYWLMDT